MPRCGECGYKDLVLKDLKGEVYFYAGLYKIVLEESIKIRTCPRCKNQVVSSKDIMDIEEACKKAMEKYGQSTSS